MKTHSHSLTVICALAFILAGSGCSLAKRDQSAKDLFVERQKKKDQLYQELSQKTLKTGTPSATILEKFGEPDDKVKSGSSSSSFEIWTYEKMLSGKKEEKPAWDIIMLYFDNNQLVTWKY